MYRKLIV